MAAIAFALGSSLLWGLSDYLGGVKSRTFPVPVVLARDVPVVADVVMALFVGARGEGPPDAAAVLARRWAPGWSGSRRSAAFYRALAIGTMSIVAPIASTGVALPVLVGLAAGDRPGPVRSAGAGAGGRRRSCLASREAPRRARRRRASSA